MTVFARHRRANGTQNPLIGKLESDASSIASRKPHCHRHEHVHVHVRDGISFSNARRRIKRSCSNKLEVLAGFLSLVIITLLLTHWMGLVSFFDTKFEYNSMEFQLDREFFEHPRDIPILVVGGTDGSGTRAFVDTLKSLGVLIVADDPHTFDIHASIMFKKLGWPQLILTVLEATKGSLDYQWSSLPGNTRSIIEREVRKLRLSLAAKYAENKRRIRLAEVMRNRQEPGKNGVSPRVVATDVAFAFKAPISMLVLPILTEFMGPIKFLHVVREYVTANKIAKQREHIQTRTCTTLPSSHFLELSTACL